MHGVSAALQEARHAEGAHPHRTLRGQHPASTSTSRAARPRAARTPNAKSPSSWTAAHASFTMDKDKESILDAGLRNGIDMPYSCKGGVCSTCRCKFVEGEVDMDVNYALEDYEVARGFVLAARAFR